MVTISGKQPKRRAEPSIAKYGKHFGSCYRQTKPYCEKHKKKGETVSQCAQGICHWHMRYGECAIGQVHKYAEGKRGRAGPGKQYLARLEKRRKKKGGR